MNIYLAARYSRRTELCSYRETLEAMGHVVQARWLNGEHQLANDGQPIGETGEALVESGDGVEAARLRTRFALDDWEDVNAAELVISFTEEPRAKANRGGRHVEYGIGLANKARVIVIGHRENIFHWLPQVEFFPTWEDALGSLTLKPTDALTDRVNAWLSQAMTRVVIRPLPDTDTFVGTLPPFRKFAVVERSESQALAEMRTRLENWARHELLEGRELHTWESKIPEVTPAAKSLVRISNLRHELRVRGAAFGAERQNLPAGEVERCLAAIDATVTRHAMQMNGVTPPPANLGPNLTA